MLRNALTITWLFSDIRTVALEIHATVNIDQTAVLTVTTSEPHGASDKSTLETSTLILLNTLLATLLRNSPTKTIPTSWVATRSLQECLSNPESEPTSCTKSPLPYCPPGQTILQETSRLSFNTERENFRSEDTSPVDSVN